MFLRDNRLLANRKWSNEFSQEGDSKSPNIRNCSFDLPEKKHLNKSYIELNRLNKCSQILNVSGKNVTDCKNMCSIGDKKVHKTHFC